MRLLPPRLLLPLALLMITTARADLQRLFVGTYTNTSAKGIYTATFDPATGELSAPALAAEIASPSFLAVTPDRRALFAVSEPTKSLHAYALDAATGTLAKLNELPSEGAAPCDVSVDATGRSVAIANYNGGSAVSYRLADNGALSALATLQQHVHATSAHPTRQTKPHAHGVTFSPDNRLLLVPDLGGDRVYLYDHDAATSTLAPHAAQPWLEIAPGSGPRHAHFSPDGKQLYIITELANTIVVADFDATAGTLTIKQTVPTLPADFTGQSTTAEVAISTDGRTVYGSNRGHDSIAVYARNPADGTLSLLQIQPCGGRNPRHFALSSDGGWLLCANQDGDSITTFRVDPATGELSPSGLPPVALARPVCVRFL